MLRDITRDKALLWIHYNGKEIRPDGISSRRWRAIVRQLRKHNGLEIEYRRHLKN
jgi:hypothetical protein